MAKDLVIDSDYYGERVVVKVDKVMSLKEFKDFVSDCLTEEMAADDAAASWADKCREGGEPADVDTIPDN